VTGDGRRASSSGCRRQNWSDYLGGYLWRRRRGKRAGAEAGAGADWSGICWRWRVCMHTSTSTSSPSPSQCATVRPRVESNPHCLGRYTLHWSTANESLGPGLDRPASLTHRRHFSCTSTRTLPSACAWGHSICTPSRSLFGRPLPCATHSLVVALNCGAVALDCGAMAFCIRANMPIQSASGMAYMYVCLLVHVHARCY
jgi:hypothetical protein